MSVNSVKLPVCSTVGLILFWTKWMNILQMNAPSQNSTVQIIVVKLWNVEIWKNILKLNVHNRSLTALTKVKVYSKMAVTQVCEDVSLSNID